MTCDLSIKHFFRVNIFQHIEFLYCISTFLFSFTFHEFWWRLIQWFIHEIILSHKIKKSVIFLWLKNLIYHEDTLFEYWKILEKIRKLVLMLSNECFFHGIEWNNWSFYLSSFDKYSILKKSERLVDEFSIDVWKKPNSFLF